MNTARESMLTLITAIAGLIFGAIGTGIGIYNTVQSARKDKVRLKVIPKLYQKQGMGRLCSARIPTDNAPVWHGFCVEIINIGFIPVTIDEIGLLKPDGESRIVFQPEMLQGEKLPKRLDPRTSIVCYVPANQPASLLIEGLPYVKCFYVTTACGLTVHGKSDVAKWLIKIGRKTELTEALRQTAL